MRNLLDKIESPADIRHLSMNELKELCAELRDYMIECCSTNPGHLGSSLGAVELVVGIHYVFNTPEDKVVFDVGHQAYAHKILTGRKEIFRQNRKKDGISGFPKRSESIYDAFGAGHSSTSISAALGIAQAEKARERWGSRAFSSCRPWGRLSLQAQAQKRKVRPVEMMSQPLVLESMLMRSFLPSTSLTMSPSRKKMWT